MSLLKASRHVLAVQNLEKSAVFYKNKLGCTTDWEGSGWHFLSRGNFKLMLGECPDDRSAFETNNHSYFAYIDVVGIDDLYEELVAEKVEIIDALEDKPWGQREFSIRTIDGHRIMFGEKKDT